ncbi:MAG: dienelactone hydrolase family protein [Betaproteobacteria bacterium]|jgi:carboxymethylenebutenolidase|nr:dienelactone hydrolase family protein [Betaproteobacteria bacterium]MDH4294400.1 dienelactone hydrolase family protein [Betaproteobacteria bacterium]MDH5342130.1 dienelactone hydrolase family protein [Betaproteobacteria bacterium]
MAGEHVKVKSTGGGEFDCYLALPTGGPKAPAVVMASAVHGVDADVRGIADAFATAGYIAAAPDLFWRTVPGPLPRDDKRSAERSQPRLAVVKTSEADMTDTLAMVRRLPQHNGKAAAMGFCFGGPYAVIGPKRLGYDAGIGCHSTQMKDFLDEFDGLTKPVCLIWGDQDHAAPPEVQAAYLEKAKATPNLQVHIFPGIQHGYMMRSNPKAWNEPTYKFSMDKALEILGTLR